MLQIMASILIVGLHVYFLMNFLIQPRTHYLIMLKLIVKTFWIGHLGYILWMVIFFIFFSRKNEEKRKGVENS